MVNRILTAWVALALGVLLPGCMADKPPKMLVVPEEMRRGGPKPNVSPSSPGNGGGPAANRYVFRFAEGGREYEVELPEESGGYMVKVPLKDAQGRDAFSAADEELVRQLEREKAAKASEGAEGGAKVEVADVDSKLLAKRKSYLGGLAKVNELYAARRYELALIELVNLEKDYPNDSRILAMKGSLYLKLGKNKLAREAWEKALAQNPDDESVAEALRNLASVTE